MDRLTDKPDWRRKVFDEDIVQRWRSEVVAPQDLRPDHHARSQGFTPEMFDYCIRELRDKARDFVDEGIVLLYDVDAGVAKSDSLVSEELKQDLRAAVRPLEDVPDKYKDWHPGSDNRVLDLVHPSLFPLIYDCTHILPEKSVTLENCLRLCGSGEPAEFKPIKETNEFYSWEYQWLPAELAFTDDEVGVKFTSYINNLHPCRHEKLYAAIERIAAKAVPLWSVTLGSFYSPRNRVPVNETIYEYDYPGQNKSDQPQDHVNLEQEPEPESTEERLQRIQEEQIAEYDRIQRSRRLVLPQPQDYEPRDKPPFFNLRQKFIEKGLQVIVKLANIHLTPEKPKYEGGSWHVEEMLNEHICATALYYYDCENVTDSYLSFRQKIDTSDEDGLAEQNDYEGVEIMFDIKQDEPGIQDVGSIKTQEGRMLAFPNVFQHRVAPFKLNDPTRPGHRKIIALFLVDPYCRIISTARVPPQQKDWWADVVRKEGAVPKLPAELLEYVVEDVEWPMSLEEAKEHRLKLMQERTAFAGTVDDVFEEDTFNFCEH
ncbi:uncharacterized protein K452DRAFT_267025 [Aplosporella prunicola CBS 121167]|uniref:Uncharacterized protein n=1 Tax=Aplosporella prunicola CBS 121167 TaxID=1176127 RepID=A0A6A6BK10_9PEZI|nr:uncharacterized protein K452DRAFT_267025 [Aplosporella prunicola CBS 121167]KAF2143968.1 hypothetical protein K452DRAFT_267025 [Aplosporella prunicola CBS 121167]